MHGAEKHGGEKFAAGMGPGLFNGENDQGHPAESGDVIWPFEAGEDQAAKGEGGPGDGGGDV